MLTILRFHGENSATALMLAKDFNGNRMFLFCAERTSQFKHIAVPFVSIEGLSKCLNLFHTSK